MSSRAVDNGQSPAGTALAVPAFQRLWAAGLISDAGDWLMFIALPLVVLRLTGSALGTSFAFLLELLPPVLLAPIAGRVVDRLPQKRVMVVAMLAQAVALLPLLTVQDRAGLPVIYVVIVVQAALAAFFEPAKNSLLPTLVGPDRAVSANALIGLNNDLGRIIGGPLGGVLLAVSGIGVVALVDVATYLLAAGLVLTLPRTSRRPSKPAEDAAAGRAGGLLRVLAEPALRGPILVVLVASIAQGLFVVLFVFFVTGVIHGSDADVGLLRGMQAVGAIAAGAVLGVLGARLNILRLTIIGTFAFTAVTAVTWNTALLTHAVPVYALLFAVMGVPAVLMGAGLTSLLQTAANDRERGSAFAALGLGQAVGQAVGLLTAGVLQDRIGTMPLLEVQAGAYAAAAVLAAVILPRSVRRRPDGPGTEAGRRTSVRSSSPVSEREAPARPPGP